MEPTLAELVAQRRAEERANRIAQRDPPVRPHGDVNHLTEDQTIEVVHLRTNENSKADVAKSIGVSSSSVQSFFKSDEHFGMIAPKRGSPKRTTTLELSNKM
jgi:hypothetical protein